MNFKNKTRHQPPATGRPTSDLRSPASVLRPPSSEHGIALVITLILLSVTLVMALAFLAISRRERSSVTTNTDTITARLAADSGLAHAEAQIIANIFPNATTTNPFSYGLIVSTNYINPNGYSTVLGSDPANVNYSYPNGSPVIGGDYQQNLANLLYSPRPPVFITDKQSGVTDFRYYLDLNRNGRYDTNGVVTNIDNNFVGLGSSSFQIGDPEWIGVLERPDTTHGGNNKFLSRYAYVCLPVGNALDLNYIHNQVFDEPSSPTYPATITMNPWVDNFFRNQGVGTWEINLAAFLTDLNTNEWGQDTGVTGNYYQYNQANPLASPNRGVAFDDARALLTYRYANNYNSLAPANIFFLNPALVFANDGLDVYNDGRLQTTLDTNADFTADNSSLPWAGADNTNHFFTAGDLFDVGKTQIGVPAGVFGFTDRLNQAGTNVSTYDRYTYYRLLAQLGMDSAPESGKLNLNYTNVNAFGDIIPNLETNLGDWAPVQFFTNAADRMLRAYTANWHKDFNNFTNSFGVTIPFGLVAAVGITNIPVMIDGRFVYAPEVQRILQLAANIYDATTTNFYPSVFRPIFYKDATATNVYIVNYEPVVLTSGMADPQLASPIDIAELPAGISANKNVYGVPWIIGAKKNLPNFNEFYMVNAVQVTRKLQVIRPFVGANVNTYRTNQMYVFSITNYIGVSLWNSYESNFPGPVSIFITNTISMKLTNNVHPAPFPLPGQTGFGFATTLSYWPGSAWSTSGSAPPNAQPSSLSFVSTNWTFPFLTDSVYEFGAAKFTSTESNPLWETNFVANLPLPQFGLTTSNNLQAFIVQNNHVIDYVQLRGPNSTRSLNTEIADQDSKGLPAYQWSTNGYQGGLTPYGVPDQINVSRGLSAPPTTGSWKSPPYGSLKGSDPATLAKFFNAFFTTGSIYSYGTPGKNATNTERAIQAPFTPTRTAFDYTLWQANDPLVHYLVSDLNFSDPGKTGLSKKDNSDFVEVAPLNAKGDRYQPWGTIGQMAALGSGVDPNEYNHAYRDPLVWGSDYWDFPTGKLPTIGWLGRVHRGTPWQTVYLKASDVLTELNATADNIGTNTWANWTGNLNTYGAANTAPIQDRLLFDLFTTAPNANATHGQLSVNQNHLAAWSAVFSGLIVPTNLSGGYLVINPAGVAGIFGDANSQLGPIVTNINYYRSVFTNTDGLVGNYEHVGDVLRTPQFTERSPFLNYVNPASATNDELMEWLPQQTMSLLKADSTPRYVIYSYGQTLKPARDSILTGGAFFQMCTNYQIVAETVTRAVVRVEDASTAHPHVVIESYNVLPPD